MESEYIVKVGELTLKGGNLKFFEQRLKNNIKNKLKKYSSSFTGKKGRYYLSVHDASKKTIETVLATTFGVVRFGEVIRCEKNIETIKRNCLSLAQQILASGPGNRFKIEARRSDKKFPYNSYHIAVEVGEALRTTIDPLVVDVHNPDWILHIEIRDTTVIYGPTTPGPGGLPVGTAGTGMLLLSGGIDSPVAGYLMAKRGLNLSAVYFHTYPYTSDDALEKVKSLAAHIARYLCGLELFVVPFTDVQVQIKTESNEEEITLIMRAAMMRIAERLMHERGGGALVTGEALSQVASQTIESLRFTGSVVSYPVLRPCIGMDKQEIIALGRNIGTYDISILPYDDCCTVFAPRRPLIRPAFEKIRRVFDTIDLEETIQTAVEQTEIHYFSDILE
jgi:tRNA uracil 4-sulfurtransferase